METASATIEELSDERLIELAQEGNRWAFGVLVKRYMRRAYFVALGFVASPEDAEDLSQEAFIRAYRNIHRFERGRKFFTWYYQILRNLCFNHLKKKRRKAFLFAEIPETELLELRSGGESPEESLERHETMRAFWRAYESLSEQEREVIWLREFQGLSYKEIAELLGCPPGTVMSRLYNARRHLAKKMKEQGWETIN